MAATPAGLDLATSTKTLFLVSHTHWDREWYLPFQQFRFKLVRLIDRLLDILDNIPNYAHFMLDGQTVVLEDYLEIRPEREAALRRHISSGRLLVGPWYILADQFLVSGEAHIQNLLKGLKLAGTFGEPMKVGYIPDPFGHTSQMPQILKGFGIGSAVFWRGVGPKISQVEFVWEASDGSTVDAVHLPNGYNSALAFNAGVDPALNQVKTIKPYLIDRSASGYVLLMNGDDHAEPQPDLPGIIEQVKTKLAEKGQPFEFIHGTLPQYLELIRATGIYQNPETPRHQGEFRDSQLAYLLPGVLSARMWIKQWNNLIQNLLEREAGPLLAWDWSLSSILPSPENDQASLQGHYQLAWKYLLQNHPHDSICGCSIDQVHEEMKTRFAWAEQIGSNLKKESQRRIAQNLDTVDLVVRAAGDEKAVPVVIFNPLPSKRTEVAFAPLVTREALEDFVIVDQDGALLPHRVMRQARELLFSMDIPAGTLQGMAAQGGDEGRIMDYTMAEINFQRQPDHPEIVEVDVMAVYQSAAVTDPELMRSTMSAIEKYLEEGAEIFRLRAFRQEAADIAFLAKDVPGCGYKSFIVRQRKPGEPSGVETTLTPVAGQSQAIENEFYQVSIDARSGTITVKDKETGLSFEDVNRFRDIADAGDEYNFCPVEGDFPVEKLNDLQIRSSQTALQQILEVKGVLELPESLNHRRQARSHTKVACPIMTLISLTPGLKRVDFEATFENRAKDHRLQVVFPAPFKTGASEAEQAFDIVSRPVELPAFDESWKEDPVSQGAMKSFVSISAPRREQGLTLMARGLPEYEIVASGENGNSAILLTLLRCVGWLSRDDLKSRRGHAGPGFATPGAQEQGSHTFHYALMPHKGDWLKAGAHQLAHNFNHPLNGLAAPLQKGQLAPVLSFVEIQPEEAVLSTVKRSEDGQAVIVRLWNPANAPLAGRVHFYRRPISVRRSNLLEEPVSPELNRDGEDWFNFPVGPKKIVTLRVVF